MSNPNGNPKLDWDTVYQVREEYNSDPTTTYKAMATKYDLSLSGMYRIINNETWYDPDYEPPPVFGSKRGRKRSPEPPARKIASEFPYQCHVCGMGYDTTDEASECCVRRREIDDRFGDTAQGEGKYGNTKGNPFYKYLVHYDFANRRSR